MPTIDKRFLDNLKQKLSTGNRRSIYLNALAERYLTRLDLADLDFLNQSLAPKFLEDLLNKANFKFVITPQQKTSPQEQKKQQNILRRLSSISIENEDNFSEHGVKTFGFGYPILLVRDSKDPSKIIKAPLFVWSLDLERNYSTANQWTIRREEDFSISSNVVLSSYIMQQLQIQLQPVYDQFLSDSVLDKEELASLTFDQVKQLQPTLAATKKQQFLAAINEAPKAVLSAKAIDQLHLDSPVILWSGVFGLFRSQKESIMNDIDYFSSHLKGINEQVASQNKKLLQKGSSFMKHSFTLVDTDPSQQRLLHQLYEGKNLIIQGPPGTGKSQTLTGIIANTISNAGTCLVVCEKKTALDVIYNNLKELGLQELTVIIEDIYRDRATVVDSVRERAKQSQPVYKPSSTFIRTLKSCASNVQILQQYHQKLKQPITSDWDWKALVGQFLEKNKTAHSLAALNKKINAKVFNFSSAEYEEIGGVLEEGQLLFEKLGTLQHPLNALEDRFFRQANVSKVEKDIKDSLDKLSKVTNAAQRDMLTYLFEYENLLEKHYENIYLKKMTWIDKAVNLIESGFEQSHYFFNKNTGLYRSFLKSVSSKYKKLNEDKVLILEIYLQGVKFHQSHAYFDFKFMLINNRAKLSFKELLKHIEDYKGKVYEWYESRGAVIRDLVNQLSPKQVYKQIDFAQKVRSVSRNLDIFERNFAANKVFKVEFKFVSKTIYKRHKQLEGLQENLAKLQKEFANFQDYHALKFFWLSIDKRQQYIIEQLASIQPKDWAAAFSSWYLDAALSHHQNEFVPDQKNYTITRNSYEKELATLQKMLVAHTLKYWRGEQTRLVQTFHKKQAPLKLHSLYNKRGGKGQRRSSLRKMIGVAPEMFQSFFPVLLVSPSVCSSILPLVPGLFDVVIFDEASQLRLEDTFCALTRGRYKIISGDSQQMPPSDYFQSAQTILQNEEEEEDILNTNSLVNESIDYLASSESLLEYSLADGYYQESFLEVHYRSRHPYLIDFSNAAFYGNRLTPLPAAKDYKPMELVNVNGIYCESTNAKEADTIVSYLLELGNQKEKMPSVGVATFNMLQRNLILEKLQTAAIQNPSDGSTIQQLFKAGLFVKNLENIQGDERDILIISTTFGLRKDGSFLQNFGPINRQNGYRLLNVIITRAKKYIKVFTSIPAEYYQRYRSEIDKNGNHGKGIFYAYLAYVEAVSRQDEPSRQAILKLVLDNCQQKSINELLYQMKDSTFENHITAFIQKKRPNIIIKKNYQYGGFLLSIAVFDAKNRLKIAFYYDIYTDTESKEAYAWDIFNEQRLADMGIRLYRIWSKEWWDDTKVAKAKLLNQLDNLSL